MAKKEPKEATKTQKSSVWRNNLQVPALPEANATQGDEDYCQVLSAVCSLPGLRKRDSVGITVMLDSQGRTIWLRNWGK